MDYCIEKTTCSIFRTVTIIILGVPVARIFTYINFLGVPLLTTFFYNFQKADPAQFVRAYGRPCKINLDPAIALAAESPQSM